MLKKIIPSLLPKLRDNCRRWGGQSKSKRRWKTRRKWSSRYNSKAAANMNSQQLRQCAKDLCKVKITQLSAWREKRCEVLSLSGRYGQLVAAWGRESIFIMTVALGKSAAQVESHMSKNTWAAHIGLNYF